MTLLCIDEMERAVSEHLFAADSGYAREDWRQTARCDTGASTRVTVHTVSFHNVSSTPRKPSNLRSIVLREGWLMLGGMEHGSHDMYARGHIINGAGDAVNHAEFADAAALQRFLELHVPTGARLAELVAAERVVAIETARIAEAEARRNAAIDSCVFDAGVAQLVAAVSDALRTKLVDGRPVSLTPALCARLVARVNATVARALEAAL